MVPRSDLDPCAKEELLSVFCASAIVVSTMSLYSSEAKMIDYSHHFDYG